MKEITAWERVEIARDPKRKTSLDYIENIFDDFIELHGDRNFSDDKAIVCGLSKIENQNFTIIAEQKGRTTNIYRYKRSISWDRSRRKRTRRSNSKIYV